MGRPTRRLNLGDTINLDFIHKYACEDHKSSSSYSAYSRVYGTRDVVIDLDLIRWGVRRNMDVPFMIMVRPNLAYRYSEAREEIIEKYAKRLMDIANSPGSFSKLSEHTRLVDLRTDEIVNLVLEYLSKPTERNLSKKSAKKE